MALYKKLLDVQARTRGLAKDAKGNGYTYVSGSKVLGCVRPAMDELGLILKQEVTDVKCHREDYATKSGQRSEMFTQVAMKFTWVDTESGETDENLFFANGMNSWDKGLGSALTYAERYFLLKYFHIPTDEDDVDYPRCDGQEPHQQQQPQQGYQQPQQQPQKQQIERKVIDLKKASSATFCDQLCRWVNDKFYSTMTDEQKMNFNIMLLIGQYYDFTNERDDAGLFPIDKIRFAWDDFKQKI